MTTIEIPERDIVRTIPSCWSELASAQVQHIFRLYFRCLTGQKSLLDFNLRVLYYLLDLRRSWRSVMIDTLSPTAAENRNANLFLLCDQCLGFLFAEPRDGMPPQLNFDDVQNPMPTVRSGFWRQKLLGPADLLQDLTFGEFRHASTALNLFFKNKNISDLHECIAFLYRRPCKVPNRAGRKVRSVDAGSLSADIRRVARLKDWQKHLIVMWFSACLDYLQRGTIEIDGEEIDLAQLFADDQAATTKSNLPPQTWNDLLIQIAKDQIVGNAERVDEEPLFAILQIMWHNLKENKRYEKTSKSH